MVLSLTLSFQKPLNIYEQQTHFNNSNKDYNSLIKHQAKLKNDQAILSIHTQMEALNLLPDSTSLPLVLKACARFNAVDIANRIFNRVSGTHLMSDVRVGTAFVDLYVKLGFLDEGVKVFVEMPERDLVSWNAMLNGYVSCGYYDEAVSLVVRMQKEGFRPNSRTVVALLSACGEVPDMRCGKEVHGFCLRNGFFESDYHVGTALIGFYLCHDVRVSRLVFDRLVVKNVVSWNAMITGYFNVGDCSNALKVFQTMVFDGVEFDSVTVLIVIQACAKLGALTLALQIHAMAVKKYRNDLFIINALLNMYSEIGNLEISREIFDNVAEHWDVALWNSMILAFVEHGYYDEAIRLFNRMREEGTEENGRTIVIMLSLCEKLTDYLKQGKSIHALVSKNRMEIDVCIGNALLGMYTEQNCVESVMKVFHEMSSVDVVSYNTLILALARADLRAEAWEIFETMRESVFKPNSHTMISIVASCDDETCLDIGRSVHGFAIKHGIEINQPLNTALTEMYMSCGDEATARDLFDGYSNRDLISWNALIASYIKNNRADKALVLFSDMISEVEPNSVTIINILSSCTHLANLPFGQSLHAYVCRSLSFGFDLSLTNAFISMYARCGSMRYAEMIFESLPKRNIISWNAIITGYGMHGRGHEAIHAFIRMLEDGFRPNGVTFVSLLSACSHSGLIDEGVQIYHSMVEDFNITPDLAHYGCMVDLLGRGGYLKEAKEFMELMPIEPDASIWRALLSAIPPQADIKEAECVFKKIIALEPVNAGNYVMISNIYAAAGLWLEVKQIRTWLKETDLKKPPGISWIVVRSEIHFFTAGAKSHPQSNQIYQNLTSLLATMKDIRHIYEED